MQVTPFQATIQNRISTNTLPHTTALYTPPSSKDSFSLRFGEALTQRKKTAISLQDQIIAQLKKRLSKNLTTQ